MLFPSGDALQSCVWIVNSGVRYHFYALHPRFLGSLIIEARPFQPSEYPAEAMRCRDMAHMNVVNDIRIEWQERAFGLVCVNQRQIIYHKNVLKGRSSVDGFSGVRGRRIEWRSWPNIQLRPCRMSTVFQFRHNLATTNYRVQHFFFLQNFSLDWKRIAVAKKPTNVCIAHIPPIVRWSICCTCHLLAIKSKWIQFHWNQNKTLHQSASASQWCNLPRILVNSSPALLIQLSNWHHFKMLFSVECFRWRPSRKSVVKSTAKGCAHDDRLKCKMDSFFHGIKCNQNKLLRQKKGVPICVERSEADITILKRVFSPVQRKHFKMHSSDNHK